MFTGLLALGWMRVDHIDPGVSMPKARFRRLTGNAVARVITGKKHNINYVNGINCLHSYYESIEMLTNPMKWGITAAVILIFRRLTAHHQLHAPEHVGAFAGSYLRHGDWDKQ